MSSSPSSRTVNDLLHTLRDEHFRREQNAQRSRAPSHVHPPPTQTHSLPVQPSLATTAGDDEGLQSVSNFQVTLVQPTVAGPPPPKSWITTPVKTETKEAHVAWRATALQVMFERLRSPSFPPLTELCLRRLLSSFTEIEFTTDIAPRLPAHLRRDLMRYTALKAPLSNARLYSLCEPEGHAHGELIVIGPEATLKGHIFEVSEGRDAPRDDWDSPVAQEDSGAPPLHTFILVSSYISKLTFLQLPSTLTRLALVKVPSALPIHRLPRICPLLVILDLSYNEWLEDEVMDRVVWTRWSRLEVLGLRGCDLNPVTLDKVNRERWNDVKIVR